MAHASNAGALKAKKVKALKPIVDSNVQIPDEDDEPRIPADNTEEARRVRKANGLLSPVRQIECGLSFWRDTDSTWLLQPRFLPKSRLHLGLLEINIDPAAHFLQRPAAGEETRFIISAPPGMPSQLAELFKFPVNQPKTLKRGAPAADGERMKRARSASEAADAHHVEDVEFGRRAETPADAARTPGDDGGFDGFQDNSGFDDYGDGADQSALQTSFQFDLEQDAAVNLDIPQTKADGPSVPAGAKSKQLKANEAKDQKSRRNESLEPMQPLDLDIGDVPAFDDDGKTSILAIFDGSLHTQSQTQTQTQTQKDSEDQDSAEDPAQLGGWSKSTVMALKVLKAELRPEEGEASMSFDRVANKVRGLFSSPWNVMSDCGVSRRPAAVQLQLFSSRIWYWALVSAHCWTKTSPMGISRSHRSRAFGRFLASPQREYRSPFKSIFPFMYGI